MRKRRRRRWGMGGMSHDVPGGAVAQVKRPFASPPGKAVRDSGRVSAL